MNAFTRRGFVAAFAGLVALGLSAGSHAEQARVLKLSHQFPAASGDSGDFRDRMAKKFAEEVEKKSG